MVTALLTDAIHRNGCNSAYR